MKKIINYLPFAALFLLLLLFYPGAAASSWRSSSDVHALLEFASSLLAITAGIMVLLHFLATGRRLFLIISIGFVLIGTEEFVHAIFSFNYIWPEILPSFKLAISTTWLAGNFILAASFFIAILFGKKEIASVKRRLYAVVYNVIAFIFAVFFSLLIFISPFVPHFVQLGSLTKKLIELSLALLFFAAFLFYSNLYIKRQSRSPLLWSIGAFIIFRVAAHIFVFDARAFYDAHWDIAHLIVFLSYFFPIFGIWGETIKLHRSAQAQLIELEKEITKRNRAESQKEVALEALLESEERYRTLFENTGTSIIIIEEDATISLANEEFARRTGYTRSEIEGKKKWMEIVDKEDIERMVAQHQLRRESPGDALPSYEFRYRTKSGELRYALTNVQLVPGTRKSMASLIDITERKRASDAVRESELRFKAQYQGIPIPTFTWRKQGEDFELIDYNDAAKVITHEKVIELVGRKASDLYANRQDILRDLQQCFIEKKVIRRETSSEHFAPGKLIALTMVSIPSDLVMVHMEDVTERKRAEEKIKDLAKFPSENPFPVLRLDKDGIVLYANEASAGLLQHWGCTVGSHAPTFWRDLVAEALSSQSNRTLVIEFGEQTYSFDLVPIVDAGYVNLYGDNITERKRAEEALRESEVRFRELFNRISSGVAVYEAIDNGGDFILRDFNPAAEKIEKVSRKDILGKRVSEVFPGVKEFGVFQVFQRVWQTGKPEYYPENIYKDEKDSGSWRESWVFKLPTGEIVAIYNDVTERKRAESQREVALEELKKSSQLLRETGEMAKVGGWELDLSTQEVSWTEEVYRIHGVEPGYKPKLEEAVNFYVPESRPVLEATLKKTAETGEPFDLESLFIPQGSKDKIWVRSIGRAVYSDGKLTKLAGKFQNIDKYKRVEESLRESEGIFNQFLTASPVLVYVKNEKHRFYKLSKSFEDLFGKPTSELIGKDLYDLLPPELAKIVFEDDLKVLKGGISVNAEEKLNDKVFSSIKFPIHRESGKPDYLGGFSVDITERKRAESQKEAALEALRQAEENFRRSLDESPLGVRIVTVKGETIYANRTLLDFYDYDSVAELNHMTLRQRYTPASYEEYKKRRKARERGRLGPGEYEISIVRKNGEVRQLQVFRKAIIWNGAKQFQALYRDISESKQWLEKFSEFEQTIQGQKMLLDQQTASVEELIERLTRSREELGASYRELKAKKDDLVRSEKLAFTGRIAAGIAHEIRNPLTNVILSLRQLKKGEKIKPEILKYAEIMERNTSRIEYLITELLNCARPLKLNLQPGDIHSLIQDILNVHNVRLKTQKIKVLQNLTSQPSILLFDKEQLGRVFLNLIANAIDAMRKGGKLSIATKSEKKKFLIKIQDSGCGIPEKNLIKVFDPFFSTKKRGAGLGLSICQNIVASHGGLIEVESAWRKGSAFSVSLPFEPKPLDRKENMAGKP